MMLTLEQKASELMAQVTEIIRRYRSRQRDFVREAETELNHREVDALLLLGLEGAMTMSRLAQDLVLSVSSATMIVDKLVQKGIVSREHSSNDRRVVMIQLTQEGEQTFRVVHEDFLHIGRTILGSLTEPEQDTLLDLYRKIASKV